MSFFGGFFITKFDDFFLNQQILHHVPLGNQQYRKMFKYFYFHILSIPNFTKLSYARLCHWVT